MQGSRKRAVDTATTHDPTTEKRTKTNRQSSLLLSFVSKSVLLPHPLECVPVKPADLVDHAFALSRATAPHQGLDAHYKTWCIIDQVVRVTAVSRLVMEYVDPPVDVDRFVHVFVACGSLPPAGVVVEQLPGLLETTQCTWAEADDCVRVCDDLSLAGWWPDTAQSPLHAQPLPWHRVAMACLGPKILHPSSVDAGYPTSVVLEGGQWCADIHAGRIYPAAPTQRTNTGRICTYGSLHCAPTGAGKTSLAISLARVRTGLHRTGTVVVVPGQHRVCLPGTTVVVVPPHLVSQWRSSLHRAVGARRLLTVENVRGLRDLRSPEHLAQYRFVLVNATFLSSNTRALQAEWEVVRATLAMVTFGARIIDEFTEVVPGDRGVLPFRSPVFFSQPKALSLVQSLFVASTTLLVSATPFTDLSTRRSNLLAMAVLLGAEYNGRILFGATDDTFVFKGVAEDRLARGAHTSECSDVVDRVLYAIRQPYFLVPPTSLHELSVHLATVPPSPVTSACTVHGLDTSLRGVRLAGGYVLPTADAFRTHYDRVDWRGLPYHRAFRGVVDRMVRLGKADIRDTPETTVCPTPVTLFQTGSPRHRVDLSTTLVEETPSFIPDGWVAVARAILSCGETAHVLLYVRADDLATMTQILSLLDVTVLVLKGNSKALSARIERFKGGRSAAMVVPSSHCSGMNLPMVTHVIVPYLPTDCSQASLRQVIGRVQRHGSTSHTQVLFVAPGMECAAQQGRALMSIEP